MSKYEVSAPVSSAPTDRLALGVGWVRPGAGGIGGTLNPSVVCFPCACFEGDEQ